MTFFCLNSPWFEYIQNGAKIYEGRRRTPKIALLQPGDTVSFYHYRDKDREPFSKKIKKIHNFKTFEEGLTVLPLGQCLPGVTSIDEGVRIYLRFVSIETQIKDGIVMIELE